jgi:hypothetical protein
MRLEEKLFGPEAQAKLMMCASTCQQVPNYSTVLATVSMLLECPYVLVFERILPVGRESSGSDLRALHGVPEHPKSSFKPLIFKGFFVFDVP